MAGVITTASHPKALWPGVKAWWGQVYNEHATEYTDLFDTDTSTQNYEEDVQLSGFGLVPVKTEGQGVNYDSEIQGFTTRYTHIAYALGYIVTKEELDDNLYEQVSKRRAAALAMSFRKRKRTLLRTCTTVRLVALTLVVTVFLSVLLTIRIRLVVLGLTSRPWTLT